MGTDIHGYIEVRDDCYDTSEPDDDGPDVRWHPVGDLDHFFTGRNYFSFGCLFGVRDGSFEPLAAGRGFPGDASRAVARAFADEGAGYHSPSWISWAELDAVDWDEPAGLEPHPSAFEYRRGPDGQWVWKGCGTSSERLAELIGTDVRTAMWAGEHWPEGTEWLDGDRLFRIARLSRRQAVPDGQWGDVWTVMRTLARRHGPDNVRLVVWFDN
ncbi:hypothetical protein ACFYW1_10305 [Streptomyces sp. NPDC002669]|uniref:hypothetical protein n=1 Tax=Streptomyces sp. NPDC002669 TaxID=3364658 RepID=UPI00368E5C56